MDYIMKGMPKYVLNTYSGWMDKIGPEKEYMKLPCIKQFCVNLFGDIYYSFVRNYNNPEKLKFMAIIVIKTFVFHTDYLKK